jgi:hypothetical protein
MSTNTDTLVLQALTTVINNPTSYTTALKPSRVAKVIIEEDWAKLVGRTDEAGANAITNDTKHSAYVLLAQFFILSKSTKAAVAIVTLNNHRYLMPLGMMYSQVIATSKTSQTSLTKGSSASIGARGFKKALITYVNEMIPNDKHDTVVKALVPKSGIFSGNKPYALGTNPPYVTLYRFLCESDLLSGKDLDALWTFFTAQETGNAIFKNTMQFVRSRFSDIMWHLQIQPSQNTLIAIRKDPIYKTHVESALQKRKEDEKKVENKDKKIRYDYYEREVAKIALAPEGKI